MKPTLLVTFDAPELETSFWDSKIWKGHSVFSVLGFTGRVGWHKESLNILKTHAFPTNIILFLTYLFYAVYTRFRKAKTIFEILEENEIKTTFFGLAANIDKERSHLNQLYYNPAIFEKIIEKGHELGLHGYLHRTPSTEDFEKSLNLFRDILGVVPETFSTPYGSDNEKIERLLKEYGFKGWRVWKYESDFKGEICKLKYVTQVDKELLDKLVEENGIIAWNLHMPDIFPLFPRKTNSLENTLKEIKKRGIWTPTFIEFCEYIKKDNYE